MENIVGWGRDEGGGGGGAYKVEAGSKSQALPVIKGLSKFCPVRYSNLPC